MKVYFIAFWVCFLSLNNATASEHDFAKPTGKIILSVSVDASKARIEFDREMLMQLDVADITTSTPWTESADVYRGPLLRSLLDKLAIKSENITISALNDYKATMPISDADQYDVILATEVNGKVMSIRDKGPIFILYPFDENPSLKNEVIYNRSVWQVNRIDAD